MKRIFAVVMTAVMLFSLCAVSAAAEGATEAGSSADVYVTFADKDGKLAVTAEKIAVTDSDSDGALTVSDALYAAHEAFYEGGAAAGYETSVSQYGLGIAKLWGSANGGSYGYYVNNAAAWALTDTIKEGDYVAAFVYTDLVGWSDNYSYFDSFMGDVEADKEITLTYLRSGYDESWNPVILPVEGAVITIDGEATEIKTDAEGKAVVKLNKNGKHIISATYEAARLMAPVYIASVTGGIDPTEAATEAPTEAPTQAATKAAVNNAVVKTGSDFTFIRIILAGMALAVAAVVFKKRNA